MTLGCDVRLAASGAKLGLNFARLGVLPGLVTDATSVVTFAAVR